MKSNVFLANFHTKTNFCHSLAFDSEITIIPLKGWEFHIFHVLTSSGRNSIGSMIRDIMFARNYATCLIVFIESCHLFFHVCWEQNFKIASSKKTLIILIISMTYQYTKKADHILIIYYCNRFAGMKYDRG